MRTTHSDARASDGARLPSRRNNCIKNYPVRKETIARIGIEVTSTFSDAIGSFDDPLKKRAITHRGLSAATIEAIL